MKKGLISFTEKVIQNIYSKNINLIMPLKYIKSLQLIYIL